MLSRADLWLMKMEAAGWGEPQSIGVPVNTAERELCPSASKAGAMYYCTSEKNYTSRIQYSKHIGDTFASRATLGREINGHGDSHHPCISPDESHLIFTSYRSGGFGDADLHISFRTADGA